MDQKKVDIIVVNWNAAALTLHAVAPYLNYSSARIFCNVIIVDNASSDNSLLLFKEKVHNIIVNHENAGFGKACNQAFVGSDADYILLLNPDTISKPAVLEKLVDFLEKNPSYAIAGPAQLDENNHVLKTCGRFPTFKTAFFEVVGLSKIFPKVFTPAPLMTDWDHLQSQEVDHVMGSYMLIRKSILDEVGFMDERYFVYMEDLDLSKRISDAGFKAFYNQEVAIFHEGGGTGEKLKERRLFYSLTSRRIYWKKHFNRPAYFSLVLGSIFVEPFLRMIDSVFKEKKLNFRIIKQAYFMYIDKLVGSKSNI
jgi:GT2 family glycosyltransferase